MLRLLHDYIHLHSSESETGQSCPILCNPVDCSLQGSSIHGILQARILEWVAIPFSKRSSHPRDWTRVSQIAGSALPSEPSGKLQSNASKVTLKIL